FPSGLTTMLWVGPGTAIDPTTNSVGSSTRMTLQKPGAVSSANCLFIGSSLGTRAEVITERPRQDDSCLFYHSSAELPKIAVPCPLSGKPGIEPTWPQDRV